MHRRARLVRLLRNVAPVGLLVLVVSACPVAAQDGLPLPPTTGIEDFFFFNSRGIPPIRDDWRLRVDGAVETPLSLDLEMLRQLPASTEMATLECAIPGGTALLVGNATWTGVPLETVLEAAGPLPEASSVQITAADGYSLGDYDLAKLLSSDDIILAYDMNGQALPPEQGYPLRLVVPATGGFNWIQWVEHIEIKTTPPTFEFDYLPQHARILRPRAYDVLTLGAHTILGMAISGRGREITAVEVSLDGGLSWDAATLLSTSVPNTWKHWEFTWEPQRLGQHHFLARTYDDTGALQNEDGAYGWRGFVVVVLVEEDDDADGVANSVDNCPGRFNPSQRDSDADGTGDICDRDCPDLDGRDPVSFVDFAFLASVWRRRDGGLVAGDLNADGFVNALDLRLLADYWLSMCCPD